jgi:serine/threonine protein kinase
MVFTVVGSPNETVLIKFLGASGWVLKIADFGFTAVAESGKMTVSAEGRMTPIYCAPELLVENTFSKKSDIWAFGCILYEWAFCCLGRRRAFSSLTAISSYYFNKNTHPPKITWETLQLSPLAIPIRGRPYREAVEQQWDHLNTIFESIFDRNPEERSTAESLMQALTQYNQDHHARVNSGGTQENVTKKPLLRN